MVASQIWPGRRGSDQGLSKPAIVSLYWSGPGDSSVPGRRKHARSVRRPGCFEDRERGRDQEGLPHARQEASSRQACGRRRGAEEVPGNRLRLRHRRRQGEACEIRRRRDRRERQSARLRSGRAASRRSVRRRRPGRRRATSISPGPISRQRRRAGLQRRRSVRRSARRIGRTRRRPAATAPGSGLHRRDDRELRGSGAAAARGA